MRLVCWALQDRRGRFVQHDAVVHFEAMRTVTFRTRREALLWLANDPYWRHRATPIKVNITVKEM
jgi:hypothetical protein